MLNSQRPENVRLRAEGGRRTGGEGEPKVGREPVTTEHTTFDRIATLVRW